MHIFSAIGWMFMKRSLRPYIAVLLLGVFCMLLPAAVRAEVSKAVPFAYSNAALQAKDVTMSAKSYKDAILFTMGYTGYSNGETAEVTYCLDGQYTSLSFSAGYVSGAQRSAAITVIADGSTLVDGETLQYDQIARRYMLPVAGVRQLAIRFHSGGYDKTCYAMAAITLTGNPKEASRRVSDEFYNVTAFSPPARGGVYRRIFHGRQGVPERLYADHGLHGHQGRRHRQGLLQF